MLRLRKAEKKYLLQRVVLWKGHSFSASVTDLYVAVASHCQDSDRERKIFLQRSRALPQDTVQREARMRSSAVAARGPLVRVTEPL